MCRILWSLIGSLLKVPRNRRCVSQKALWDCPAMLAKMNRGSECVINKFSKFAQKVRGKKLWVQHELLRYKAASIVKCLYTNQSWEICAKCSKIQAKWSSRDTKVHRKIANCLKTWWNVETGCQKTEMCESCTAVGCVMRVIWAIVRKVNRIMIWFITWWASEQNNTFFAILKLQKCMDMYVFIYMKSF